MERDKREKISKWKRESDGGRVESSREKQIQIQSYIRNPHSKQQALIPIFTLTTGWQGCRGGGITIQDVLFTCCYKDFTKHIVKAEQTRSVHFVPQNLFYECFELFKLAFFLLLQFYRCISSLYSILLLQLVYMWNLDQEKSDASLAQPIFFFPAVLLFSCTFSVWT